MSVPTAIDTALRHRRAPSSRCRCQGLFREKRPCQSRVPRGERDELADALVPASRQKLVPARRTEPAPRLMTYTARDASVSMRAAAQEESLKQQTHPVLSGVSCTGAVAPGDDVAVVEAARARVGGQALNGAGRVSSCARKVADDRGGCSRSRTTGSGSWTIRPPDERSGGRRARARGGEG
jgi:hypothetical protein